MSSDCSIVHMDVHVYGSVWSRQLSHIHIYIYGERESPILAIKGYLVSKYHSIVNMVRYRCCGEPNSMT